MKESLSLDEKFISNIFEKYTKAKIILQKSDFTSLQEKAEAYGQPIESELLNYSHHIEIVETILSLLPKEEYICLIRDFLSFKKSNFSFDKEWWKKYYSKEKYQKLRTQAISRFLYLFLI